MDIIRGIELEHIAATAKTIRVKLATQLLNDDADTLMAYDAITRGPLYALLRSPSVPFYYRGTVFQNPTKQTGWLPYKWDPNKCSPAMVMQTLRQLYQPCSSIAVYAEYRGAGIHLMTTRDNQLSERNL